MADLELWLISRSAMDYLEINQLIPRKRDINQVNPELLEIRHLDVVG